MQREEFKLEMEKVNECKKWYYEMLAGRVIQSLERNNIPAIYTKTKEEAVEKALSLIPKGSKVGYGGSLTLKQTGMIRALRNGDFHFIDRSKPDISQEENERLFKESLLADVFLMSTNALTEDGKLVNIDAAGNRVAALSYGPSKVIIIAGVNKIVADHEAAIRRIKKYVTPIHAKRRDRPFPCAEIGTCVDCHMKERWCNIVTVIEHQRHAERITVIISGEELGI